MLEHPLLPPWKHLVESRKRHERGGREEGLCRAQGSGAEQKPVNRRGKGGEVNQKRANRICKYSCVLDYQICLPCIFTNNLS